MNPGDKVLVRLFDGRTLSGTVKRTEETTAGTKIIVHSGDMALKVNPQQIIKTGGSMNRLSDVTPANGMRVRYWGPDQEKEPQGTLTDVGYGAVTITWDDSHPQSNVPRGNWHTLEVI